MSGQTLPLQSRVRPSIVDLTILRRNTTQNLVQLHKTFLSPSGKFATAVCVPHDRATPALMPHGVHTFPKHNRRHPVGFSSARFRGSLNSLNIGTKITIAKRNMLCNSSRPPRPMLPPEILLMPRQETRRLIREAVVTGILGGYLKIHLDGGEREHIHAQPPSRCTTYPLPQSVQIRSLSGKGVPRKSARAVEPVFYYGASAFRSRPLLNIRL